jgi:glyoxylase-like metal-dependent hydrolase (beta-lactamase superfamily II)
VTAGTDPAGTSRVYEHYRAVTPLAGVVLADNAGPMTLQGTNTWLLAADPAQRTAIVIDPGPDTDAHLDAILEAAGRIVTILLTHHHLDHSAGAARLHDRTGAPVLALDPARQLGAEGLTDGQRVSGAGVDLQVWTTPGHTADSLSFILEGDDRAVLTGDTILGQGTTVVAHPDGILGDYLESLERLRALDGVTVLPGHGPELADAGAAAAYYLQHRSERLDQVRRALVALGADCTTRQLVERVYADVDPVLWPAAELSVAAQLDYLRRQ